MQEFNPKILKFLLENSPKGLVRIAEELGINYNLLISWHKGRHKPSQKNLEKLAKYFDLDDNDFFKELNELDVSVFSGFNHDLFSQVVKNALNDRTLKSIYNAIGVSERQFNRWLSGESRPHNGNIDKICSYFNIDRSALFQDTPLDLPPPPPVVTPSGIHIVTVDTKNNPVIKLVPMAAQAGYLAESIDPEYWEELPEISISHHRYHGREMRAFEVAGDSMEPAILHSDWLFCARLEKPEWIQPGQVYIVVTPYSLVVKRLHYQRGRQHLTCISDNAAYPEYEVATADIRELWQCLGLHRWQIPGRGMGK